MTRRGSEHDTLDFRITMPMLAAIGVLVVLVCLAAAPFVVMIANEH